MTVEQAAFYVRKALGHRVAGWCYHASEAVYHLAGGKAAGLTPQTMRLSFSRFVATGKQFNTHWFLRDRDGKRIDVTAGQFRPRLRAWEMRAARGCGFLTKRPGWTTRSIIAEANLLAELDTHGRATIRK